MKNNDNPTLTKRSNTTNAAKSFVVEASLFLLWAPNLILLIKYDSDNELNTIPNTAIITLKMAITLDCCRIMFVSTCVVKFAVEDAVVKSSVDEVDIFLRFLHQNESFMKFSCALHDQLKQK